MRKTAAIMGILLVSPIFAGSTLNGQPESTKTPRIQEPGVQPSVVDSAPSENLLACSDAGLRNVSFSLSIPGAVMGTAPTSAQTRRTSSGTPPCTQRLTITSTPCGAAIYIDGMQSGQTPITFPMPPGRYSVVLVAPGHQRFAQRILISDAPFELKANLVPLP